MSEWKPDLYLKYEKQRSLPARDLVHRLRHLKPKRIVDLGCGPGNSTLLLKDEFSDAEIIGIDNSVKMIEKAKKMHPDLQFFVCNVNDWNEKTDLMYSNACLHWLSDHQMLFPKLVSLLNEGGTLAVQMPMNENEPLYRIIKETAQKMPYDFSNAYFEKHELLRPEQYVELLSECASNVEVWETVYYHEMDSCEDLLDWVRSTRLRPYLDCLNGKEQVLFEEEILKEVKRQYQVMKNGKIMFKFRRLFLMIEK